jgi:hypothetical protein
MARMAPSHRAAPRRMQSHRWTSGSRSILELDQIRRQIGLISRMISIKDHSYGASKTDHRPPSPLAALAVDSPSSPDAIAIAIARERWALKSDNHRTFRELFRTHFFTESDNDRLKPTVETAASVTARISFSEGALTLCGS